MPSPQQIAEEARAACAASERRQRQERERLLDAFRQFTPLVERCLAEIGDVCFGRGIFRARYNAGRNIENTCWSINGPVISGVTNTVSLGVYLRQGAKLEFMVGRYGSDYTYVPAVESELKRALELHIPHLVSHCEYVKRNG